MHTSESKGKVSGQQLINSMVNGHHSCVDVANAPLIVQFLDSTMVTLALSRQYDLGI